MPGAARRIAHRDLQQVVWDPTLGVLLDNRVECAVQQRLHQRRRCVIGAGRLPVVPGSAPQLENPDSRVGVGHQVQQRLVHQTQLFGVKMLVVDLLPAPALVFDPGEVTHRGQQTPVGQSDVPAPQQPRVRAVPFHRVGRDKQAS